MGQSQPTSTLCASTKARLVTTSLHLAVLVVYIALATDGSFRFTPTPPTRINYGLLADAFVAGQLHLKIEPRPELAQLQDPYDPKQHRDYYFEDASYYRNKYYLYFGPVPAVLRAIWQITTQHASNEGVTLVLFGIGGCVAFWMLLKELREVAAPEAPDSSLRIIWMSYALGGVGPFMVASPSIYHEAIASAAMFTLAGLFFWLRGMRSNRPIVCCVIAGVCLGCALGSRFHHVTYGLAVVAASLLLLTRSRETRNRIIALAIPLCAIGVLLLIYNQLRFGSPLEFGLRYQLTGQEEAHVRMNWRVLPLNLKAYFLLAPQIIAWFPYHIFRFDSQSGPGYHWLREACFTSVLLLAPIIVAMPIAFRRVEKPVRVFVTVGSSASLAIFASSLTLEWTAIRYAQDFLPVLWVLGAVGLWSIHKRRWLYRALVGASCACSIFFGLGLVAGAKSFGNPDQALRIAYRTDSVTARILNAFGVWPKGYLSSRMKYRPFGMDVDQDPPYRPVGIFYPDGATITCGVWDKQIDSMEVELCARESLRVAMRINGQAAGEFVLKPGWQMLSLSSPMAADSNGEIAVHFDVPGTGEKRLLWPIRIRTAYRANN